MNMLILKQDTYYAELERAIQEAEKNFDSLKPLISRMRENEYIYTGENGEIYSLPLKKFNYAVVESEFFISAIEARLLHAIGLHYNSYKIFIHTLNNNLLFYTTVGSTTVGGDVSSS